MGATRALTGLSSRAGRLASLRGEQSEQRALKAARRIPGWWFLSAWRPRRNSKLDRLGWDVVIETVDLGRIVLQVKGSEEAAARFVAHGRELQLRAPIHTIVVNDSVSDAALFGVILGTCIRAREEALAAGLTADDARLCRRAA